MAGVTPRDGLAAYLTGLSTEELGRCLARRPDVLWGAPVRDVDDLADRLVHPFSVSAAVGDRAAPALQTLEVLAAAGAGACLERAVALLDPGLSGRDADAHLRHVELAVRELTHVALIWPGDAGALVVNPGLRHVIESPLGFGRVAEMVVADIPVDELKKVVRRWGVEAPGRKADLVEVVRRSLADPARVRTVLGGAPSSVATVLLDRAQAAAQRALAGFVAVSKEDVEDDDDAAPVYLRDRATFAAYRVASSWARDNGLGFSVYGAYATDVEVPCEVTLSLVGPDFRAPFAPVPAPVPTAPVAPAQARSSASGAVTDLLSVTMAILEVISRSPLAGLKSGGVGARELAKLAKAVGAEARDVRLTLELGQWLGLFERDGSWRLTTSPTFDQWRRREPARRAADLLATWFALGYVPSIDRDQDGRSLPALARTDGPDQARTARHLALGFLDGLDDDLGVASVDALAARVAWRLPLVVGPAGAADLEVTWDEAQRLGVVAHGRLSDAGVALGAGDDLALVEALTGMLPEVATRALFGSDLTVVVPGSPDPAVVDLLDAVAVREARGAASTWRLTPESVRAALDEGHAAADLTDRLRGLADRPLPQALEYLIRDVARRYGHVQVRPALAVVQSDDQALLAEIEVHRALRRLGLRRVAPTVLVAQASADDVVAGLRGAGYLPLALGADGDPVVRLTRVEPAGGGGVAGGAVDDADTALRRWVADQAMDATGRPGVAAAPQESPAEVAERLVRGVLPPEVRSGDGVLAEIRERARRLSADEVRQLAHAVEHDQAVQIRYRSSSGGMTLRVVSGLELERGYLVGWCHLRQDERMFALASIYAVMAAPPA